MISLRPLIRQKLCYFLTGLVLFLILSSCASARNSGTSQGPGEKLRSFIDTWNNIHIIQSFDYNISDPAALAKLYDFVWGAEVNHVAAFRSNNPSIFLSYYIPFHADWGTFSDNTTLHDLAYWKSVHPNWILYRCDRITPAYEPDYSNIPLDFANPAVVSWQIETYAKPASENGYDGIAADNLDLKNRYSACGVYVNGKWVRRYTGQLNDPQWRTDVIAWLTQMQQALHSLQHPLALIPNLALNDLSPSDPQIQQIVNHVDGVVDESGFTDGGERYLTDSEWMQRIQFMEDFQKQHKPYYVVDQFHQSSPISHEELQWALASYLMGKEHLAALFISTYQGYGSDTRYSEYNAHIGSPVGNLYLSQGVYWRKYSNGLSIVNASSTNTYTVTLDAANQYIDLYGKPIIGHEVTMPPHSGMVLLINSQSLVDFGIV